jgi:hypothetical protein
MRDTVYHTCVLTHKVNQDSLDNFFSQLRTCGGLDDHPTTLNALYRIRLIILGMFEYQSMPKMSYCNLLLILR